MAHLIEKDLRKVFGKRVPQRGDNEQEFMVALVKLVGGDKITDAEYDSLRESTKAWATQAINGFKDGVAVVAFGDVKDDPPAKKSRKQKEQQDAAESGAEVSTETETGDAGDSEDESNEQQQEASSSTQRKETKMKSTTKKAATKKRAAPTKRAEKSTPKAKAKAKTARPKTRDTGAKRGNGASDTSKARHLICKHLDASSSEVADLAKKAGIEVKYLGALYYHVHSTVDTLRELGKMK